MKMLSHVAAVAFCAIELVSAYGGRPVCGFNNTVHGSMPLAAPGLNPTIVVSQSDLWGVQRAAQDLSIDFGRVTGHNGTLLNITGNSLPSGHPSLIVVGTVGSPLINSLVASNKINVSAITGQWESFMTQLVSNPAPGVQQTLVIVGADKRGAIYGVYDLSQQIGVSPWYVSTLIGLETCAYRDQGTFGLMFPLFTEMSSPPSPQLKCPSRLLSSTEVYS